MARRSGLRFPASVPLANLYAEVVSLSRFARTRKCRMIATDVPHDLPDQQRIVITGIGLTAPNGNTLPEFRESLLAGRSGVRAYEIRYFGKTLAGVCDFDAPQVPDAQGCPPRHPGRQRRHLLRPRGGRTTPGSIGRTSIRRGSAFISA